MKKITKKMVLGIMLGAVSLTFASCDGTDHKSETTDFSFVKDGYEEIDTFDMLAETKNLPDGYVDKFGDYLIPSWDIPKEVLNLVDTYEGTSSMILDSRDITREMLSNRKGNLIIEEEIGICTDSITGDGKQLNSADGEEYYIHYPDWVEEGDIVASYFVYNPDNNVFDDIIERYDTLITNVAED